MLAKVFNRILRRPLYDSGILENHISQMFKDKLISDLNQRILITSAHSDTHKVKLFKTRHHELFINDNELKVKDVAMATAAAPFYFKPHQMPDQKGAYIDGAVWSNNPIVPAIAEGIEYLNWNRTEIAVMMIEGPINYDNRGFSRLFHLHSALIDAQAHGDVAIAKQLISQRNKCGNGHERLMQFAFTSNVRNALDNSSKRSLDKLMNQASRDFEASEAKATELFFANTVDPYQH